MPMPCKQHNCVIKRQNFIQSIQKWTKTINIAPAALHCEQCVVCHIVISSPNLQSSLYIINEDFEDFHVINSANYMNWICTVSVESPFFNFILYHDQSRRTNDGKTIQSMRWEWFDLSSLLTATLQAPNMQLVFCCAMKI